MSEIDRRTFLALSSAGAASLGLAAQAGETPALEEKATRAVRLFGDGLDLTPEEFAEELREAAADGAIEPDDYSNGGAVAALEQAMAELLGKERAVFFPTGTLANQIAVRTLAGPGGRVLMQEESHLYNDSGDGCQLLSDLAVIGLAPGEATFTLDQVEVELARAATGRVATPIRAISIESPVRRLWGRVFDFDEMQRIAELARGAGIGLHLDGARMFLAEPYTGITSRDYAALFDTVYVSLWKYFNSGSGAILAGPATLLDELFHVRRMFGGSLPHGWAFAAMAHRHLEGFPQRFAQAVERSREVFRLLDGARGLAVEPVAGGTNVAKLGVERVDLGSYRENLEEEGILLAEPLSDGSGFKIQVNETWLYRSADALAEALVAARTRS